MIKFDDYYEIKPKYHSILVFLRCLPASVFALFPTKILLEELHRTGECYVNKMIVPCDGFLVRFLTCSTLTFVLIFLFLPVIATICERIEYKRKRYFLYNDRIECTEGLINRRTTSFPKRKIVSVCLRKNLFQRYYHIGTIVVESASKYDCIRLENIPDPDNTYEIIKRMYQIN